MINPVTKEHIVFDQVVVAMTQGQCATRFKEDITAKNVTAGFIRDDFHLAITTVKVIVLDHGE